MGYPTPQFPGALADSSTLAVATNRLQTALSSAIGSGDSSMTVASATGIVANSLLSIDNEIVRVTASPSGTSCAIQRAYDGTTAASHASGAAVYGFVDAWHHNTLAAEVQAIEVALGVNLANINTPIFRSSGYNYTPQTPGGSLNVGSNVITMSPMPSGLTTGGSVYISGGVGTAEVAAVTGASTTQIIVTCAYTHSGAWTVKSPTSGINECLTIAQPLGASVQLPVGVLKLYGPIQVNPSYTVSISGCGADWYGSIGTVLQPQDVTGTVNAIEIIEPVNANTSDTQIQLSDFVISALNNRQCGHGIKLKNTGNVTIRDVRIIQMGLDGINCYRAINTVIERVVITHIGNSGITFDNTCNKSVVRSCYITDCAYTDGYSGVALTATLGVGYENLSVAIEDSVIETIGGTPAHGGVTNAFSISVVNSHNTNITGNHFELASPTAAFHIYLGANSKGTWFSGNYVQDGKVNVDGGIDIHFGPNCYANYTIATGVTSGSNQPTITYEGRQTVLAGSPTFTPSPASTATATAGSATMNAQQGTVTSEALTTAAGSSYTLTLTDNMVAATTFMGATVQLGTSTQGTPQIVSVTPGTGSVVVVVKNIHATDAFNGTIKVKVLLSNVG